MVQLKACAMCNVYFIATEWSYGNPCALWRAVTELFSILLPASPIVSQSATLEKCNRHHNRRTLRERKLSKRWPKSQPCFGAICICSLRQNEADETNETPWQVLLSTLKLFYLHTFPRVIHVLIFFIIYQDS